MRLNRCSTGGDSLMVSGDFPKVTFGFLPLVYQNRTALLVLIVAKAAPCPLLRFEHESSRPVMGAP